MKGTILEKDALILRQVVGTAKDDDGNEYEMTASMDGSPLVKSMKTGRTFNLTWSDLCELAVEAGIDKEPEE